MRKTKPPRSGNTCQHAPILKCRKGPPIATRELVPSYSWIGALSMNKIISHSFLNEIHRLGRGFTLVFYLQQRRLPFSSSSKLNLLRNNQIKHQNMRVVYTEEDGTKSWKILSRAEALQFVRDRNLDLILGE